MLFRSGIGSITGSCISSFLFIACNEWLLRFLDESGNNILGMNLLRSGFRKVVFSIVIMIIVLFFPKGIMGERELSWKRLRKRASRRGKEAGADE